MAGVEEVCIIQNKELSLQLFEGYSKNKCNPLASHVERVLTVSEKAYADAIEVNEIYLLNLAQVLLYPGVKGILHWSFQLHTSPITSDDLLLPYFFPSKRNERC